MARLKKQAQTSMYDQVIESTALLADLTEWESNKGAAKSFGAAQERIKSFITERDYAPGQYRCGPFLLVIKNVKGVIISITSSE